LFLFLQSGWGVLGVGDVGVVFVGGAGDVVDAVGDQACVFTESDPVVGVGVGFGVSDVFGGQVQQVIAGTLDW